MILTAEYSGVSNRFPVSCDGDVEKHENYHNKHDAAENSCDDEQRLNRVCSSIT